MQVGTYSMCTWLECTPRRKHIPASSGMQSTPSIKGQQVLMPLLLSDSNVTRYERTYGTLKGVQAG